MMDFAPATAPIDPERQRAELALRAAAPLTGNRHGKPRAQHDASDLELFKAANEPSLFDTPPPCGERSAPSAPAAADPEPDAFDYEAHEAERVERHKRRMAEFDAERARIGAIIEAEIAAGREHRLQWGSGRFGKAPYWTLRLVERDGEVFTHEDMEMHNRGSFGGWRSEGHTTIEAVQLKRCRRRIEDAACDIALNHEPALVKHQRALASWIIEQFPPLLFGVDFAQQLESSIALFAARNKLRGEAIRAGKREYVDELGRTLTIYSLGRNSDD